jgi:hypothetical protein
MKEWWAGTTGRKSQGDAQDPVQMEEAIFKSAFIVIRAELVLSKPP